MRGIQAELLDFLLVAFVFGAFEALELVLHIFKQEYFASFADSAVALEILLQQQLSEIEGQDILV
jgi:hypothetical protein